MAQQQFNPVPDVTTHSDATTLLNSNFTDAENRLASLEASLSALNSLQLQFTQQTITSLSGNLVLDVASGHNAATTLTEDSVLTITGATSGDSGVIIIRQDVTGGWNLNSIYLSLSGLLTSVASLTANEVGVGAVSWYFDGSDYFLFISDVT